MKVPRELLAKLPPGRGVNPAAFAAAGGVAVDPAALLGPDPSEAEFQRAVIQLAERAGWKVFSIPDSRRATAGGWPDLVCGKEGRGVLAAELKKRGGRPRADQRWWLDRLAESGARVFAWTPDDLGTIREVLS